jgi:hypothetical protein
MLNRIFEIALAASIAAAAIGQLPKLLYSVQLAELQILNDSESSKWGRPFLLPIHHSRHRSKTSPLVFPSRN